MKLSICMTLAAVAASALFAAGCAGLGARPAHAATASPRQACFRARDVSSWTPVDRETVNIKVGVHDYYQLRLAGACPDIDWNTSVALKSRGTSWICNAFDAELVVPEPAGGPQRCPVLSVRKLGLEEAAALPRKQRP